MDVSVDQTGQDGLALKVDDLGAGWIRNRTILDLGDPLAIHQDGDAVAWLVGDPAGE